MQTGIALAIENIEQRVAFGARPPAMVAVRTICTLKALTSFSNRNPATTPFPCQFPALSIRGAGVECCTLQDARNADALGVVALLRFGGKVALPRLFELEPVVTFRGPITDSHAVWNDTEGFK